MSQLKRQLGPNAVPAPGLPLVDCSGKIKVAHVLVLDTRAVPRHPHLVTQWLVEWLNVSPDEATWEDANFMKYTFPEFYNQMICSLFPTQDPRGQGSSSEEGNCQDFESLHLMSTEEMNTWAEELTNQFDEWMDAQDCFE